MGWPKGVPRVKHLPLEPDLPLKSLRLANGVSVPEGVALPLKSLRLANGVSVPEGVARNGGNMETYFHADARYSLTLYPAWGLVRLARGGSERWIPVGQMLECEPHVPTVPA